MAAAEEAVGVLPRRLDRGGTLSGVATIRNHPWSRVTAIQNAVPRRRRPRTSSTYPHRWSLYSEAVDRLVLEAYGMYEDGLADVRQCLG